MGLLIGLDFTVHIMSSMIPVFLMPIAVLDSVHVLSEFYDKFPALQSKRGTIVAVYDELFTPCLYTSFTTAAGFGALVTARIPPVQVFGAFIAFGVLVAWLLTVTFLPAYLSLLREERLQQQLPAVAARQSWLNGLLSGLGRFTLSWHRTIVLTGLAGLVVAGWGLSRIEINDNPVNWFKPYHKIRVADRVMNEHFGGTYMAYLTLEGRNPDDMKRPEVMAYVEKLQKQLEATPPVGKTSSVADIVKRINYVLHDARPDAAVVPVARDEIGQSLFLFQMSGDPDDLDTFLTGEARQANIWVQMERGENKDMERVEQALQDFANNNPPPEGVELRWSGLTYINKVWQGIMVEGMLKAFLSSWVVVFLLMMFLFRSMWLGLVSMVPLTVAIVFSYAILGFVGKDYDMPVAVCASLALGLGIDYAIHFLQRFKEKYQRTGNVKETSAWIFGSPARAIGRNALVISLGFLPLVFATLTPYVTVGVFFATLMAFSALSTLLVLPALMHLFGEKLLAGAKP
jgi:predicted RND superfamily exporter protein